MHAPRIYPVIHHLDDSTTLSEAALARQCGADGVFLISHTGDDNAIRRMALAVKAEHPDWRIGINLLTEPAFVAVQTAIAQGIDMVWADRMGVSSLGLNHEGRLLSALAAQHPRLELFASVAFKYQPAEEQPAQAARQALAAGFTPTTSGSGTGSAPTVEKIRTMSQAVGGHLAVASGMSPGNIAQFAPLLRSVLVSTGVSSDEHHLDAAKLKALIQVAQMGMAAAA